MISLRNVDEGRRKICLWFDQSLRPEYFITLNPHCIWMVLCHLSKFIILVPSRLVYDVSRRGDESTHTERAAPMATPVPELSTLTLVWAPHLTWAHPDRTLLVAVVRESCQGLRIEEICIMRLVAPYHARKILEHLSGLLWGPFLWSHSYSGCSCSGVFETFIFLDYRTG